jgi:2-iminobutanoate/2-iminopropanoate deaminase
MELRKIQTPNAPTPAGHYSQAIVHNGLVYVAGQLGIDPRASEQRDRASYSGSIEEQTEQALKNVSEILKAAGSDLSRVLKMTIYVSDINLWGPVNAVFAKVMGEHRPARAIVPIKDLHYGYQIEIETIAAVSD